MTYKCTCKMCSLLFDFEIWNPFDLLLCVQFSTVNEINNFVVDAIFFFYFSFLLLLYEMNELRLLVCYQFTTQIYTMYNIFTWTCIDKAFWLIYIYVFVLSFFFCMWMTCIETSILYLHKCMCECLFSVLVFSLLALSLSLLLHYIQR